MVDHHPSLYLINIHRDARVVVQIDNDNDSRRIKIHLVHHTRKRLFVVQKSVHLVESTATIEILVRIVFQHLVVEEQQQFQFVLFVIILLQSLKNNPLVLDLNSCTLLLVDHHPHDLQRRWDLVEQDQEVVVVVVVAVVGSRHVQCRRQEGREAEDVRHQWVATVQEYIFQKQHGSFDQHSTLEFQKK